MSAAGDAPSSPAKNRITLGSGGWILLLAGLLVVAATVWRVRDMVSHGGVRAVGDGRNPDTYGFSLSPCLVPKADLVGCGLPRDGLPVLDRPEIWNVARVDSLAHARSGKYLVPGDRVIGVYLGGRARAYPLRALNWHEIVNDTLGGRAIAVTYSPLCDAAVVFDRQDPRGGNSGDTLSFGHSGLLYNSDLVLYDRRPGHRGESLWSQVAARAIAGPAAQESLRLTVLPSDLVRWDDWKALHPATGVLAMPPSQAERYSRDPYISYYGSDVLRFPVAPLPPSRDMLLKTPCLALRGADKWLVIPLPPPAADAEGPVTGEAAWEGKQLTLLYRGDPATARVSQVDQLSTAVHAEAAPAAIHCFWFAWYASPPGPYEMLPATPGAPNPPIRPRS